LEQEVKIIVLMVVDSVIKRMERMHLTLVMHLVEIVMADRQESKDEVV